MGTLATILGTVGAILLLVGLVGGGFTFSGTVMPTVGKVSRIFCFGIGGFLVLIAIGLGVSDVENADSSSTQASNGGSGPTSNAGTVQGQVTNPPSQLSSSVNPPVIAYVIAGSGNVAYVFQQPTLTSSVIRSLEDGAAVHVVCTIQGESVTWGGYTSSLWDATTDNGYVADVILNTGTDQPVAPNCSS